MDTQSSQNMTYKELKEKYMTPLAEAMMLPGQKFSYAVEKNMAKCESVWNKAVKSLRQSMDIDPKIIQDYDNAIAMAQRTYMKRNKETGAMEVDPEKKDEYNQKLRRIDNKHKKAVEFHREYRRKFAEMMNLPVSEKIGWHPVVEEDVSPMITGELRRSLAFMLSDAPKIEVIK